MFKILASVLSIDYVLTSILVVELNINTWGVTAPPPPLKRISSRDSERKTFKSREACNPCPYQRQQRQFQAKTSVSECRFSSGHNTHRLRLI
jgi:hypothetical protein